MTPLRSLATHASLPVALVLSTALLLSLVLAGTGVARDPHAGSGFGKSPAGYGSGYGYEGGGSGKSGRDLRAPKARQIGVPSRIRARALGRVGVAVMADCGERCSARWSLEVQRRIARRASARGASQMITVAKAAGFSNSRGRVRGTLVAVRGVKPRALAGSPAVLRLETRDRGGRTSTSTVLVRLGGR